MNDNNELESNVGHASSVKDHSAHQHQTAIPPAFKRAGFYINRASSHTSLQSASHFHHHHQNYYSYNNEVELSRPGTPTDQATVLHHLYKHASTFGLNASDTKNHHHHHGDHVHNKVPGKKGLPFSLVRRNARHRGKNRLLFTTLREVFCELRPMLYNCKIDILPQDMSTEESGVQHSAAFLSWRKLHLSRAKLKAASNTSALLAGFAMVAVVELQLESDEGKKLPVPLLILFAICTTLLVAVHMLALLISTCILPNMDAISNLHALSLVHESPHEKMHRYIELAWGCSTVLGILLFMIEIIILCWIQFYHVLIAAAYVATAILVPFVVLFVWFAIIFYRKLVAHTYETRKSGIQELERLKNGLEMGDVDLIGHKHRHASLDNIV